jgi:hypothetical protein
MKLERETEEWYAHLCGNADWRGFFAGLGGVVTNIATQHGIGG